MGCVTLEVKLQASSQSGIVLCAHDGECLLLRDSGLSEISGFGVGGGVIPIRHRTGASRRCVLCLGPQKRGTWEQPN